MLCCPICRFNDNSTSLRHPATSKFYIIYSTCVAACSTVTCSRPSRSYCIRSSSRLKRSCNVIVSAYRGIHSETRERLFRFINPHLKASSIKRPPRPIGYSTVNSAEKAGKHRHSTHSMHVVTFSFFCAESSRQSHLSLRCRIEKRRMPSFDYSTFKTDMLQSPSS